MRQKSKHPSHFKDKFESDRTLKELIDDFLEFGKKPAIVSFLKEDYVELSYAELLSCIRQLSCGMQERGFEKGERAIVAAGNSTDWIVACLGVIYCGGVAVPIDSQQGDEELKHIVADSEAKWIFADEQGSTRIRRLFSRKHFKMVRIDQRKEFEQYFSKEGLNEVEVSSKDLALIFYTSGTTGMPKGVPLKHESITMQLEFVAAKSTLLRAGDRVLLPLPLYHVYPLDVGLLSPLKMGLPVVLPYAATGPELLRAMNQGKATVIIAVPRLLRSFYQGIESRLREHKLVAPAFQSVLNLCIGARNLGLPNPGKLLFSRIRKKFSPSLRMFACGGALLEGDLAAKIMALGWDISVGYGLTETSPLLTIRFPDDSDLLGVGKPINGVSIRIKAGKKKEKNGDGEIEARGQNVFDGYLNLPEKTKEAFTEDGWFKTGDLGFFKNGRLHVTGRASATLVMEGGKKIQPDDIEKKYAEHPLIKEIGVLQKEHKLVALVFPDLSRISDQKKASVAEEGKPSSDEGKSNSLDKRIRKEIAGALSSVSSKLRSHMRIADFAVTRQPLPKTNLGKLKRKELEERYDKAKSGAAQELHPVPIDEMSAQDRTLMENPVVAQTWELLLRKFPQQQLSLAMSPQLDLNIDSFEWMNLSLDLLEHTGIELDENAIARIGTLRDLLTEMQAVSERQQGANMSPLEAPDHYISDKQKYWLRQLNRFEVILSRALYLLIYILLHGLFRVSAVGYEKVPKGQVVFLPNHASYIDIFALTSVLPFKRMRKTQIAAWVGIAFANPVASYLSHLGQAFPIEAKRSLISSLALAAAVLKKHKSLIWFPEGERTLDGKLLPFRPGIGILLEHSDLPIVPVYLDGTRNALPPGHFMPNLFAPIAVIFGEPITAGELQKIGKGRTPAEKIANALHDLVEELSKANRHRRQKSPRKPLLAR